MAGFHKHNFFPSSFSQNLRHINKHKYPSFAYFSITVISSESVLISVSIEEILLNNRGKKQTQPKVEIMLNRTATTAASRGDILGNGQMCCVWCMPHLYVVSNEVCHLSLSQSNFYPKWNHSKACLNV